VEATLPSLCHLERHTVPIVQEARCDTGPEWKSVEKRKNLGLTGVQTPNGPAGSVSLHPLHYPGYIHVTMDLKRHRMERCSMDSKN